MIILAILLVGIAARQGEAADPAAPVGVTADVANLGAPNKTQFDPLALSSVSSSDRFPRRRSRAPVAITPDGPNPGAPNELPIAPSSPRLAGVSDMTPSDPSSSPIQTGEEPVLPQKHQDDYLPNRLPELATAKTDLHQIVAEMGTAMKDLPQIDATALSRNLRGMLEDTMGMPRPETQGQYDPARLIGGFMDSISSCSDAHQQYLRLLTNPANLQSLEPLLRQIYDVVSSLKSPSPIVSLLTKASPMALLHIAYSSTTIVRKAALPLLGIEAALLYLYFSAMDAVSQPGRLAMLSTLTFVPSLAVSALRPAAYIAKKLGMPSIVKGVSTVMKRYGTSLKIVFSAASIPFILGTVSSLLGGQYHQTSMAMGIQTSLLMFAAYTLQTFQEQSLHLE